MRRFAWKPEKDEWLKRERGISFEQIVIAVMLEGYVVGVPATIQPTAIMLWTAYYSRKLNKRYGGKKI